MFQEKATIRFFYSHFFLIYAKKTQEEDFVIKYARKGVG